MAITGAGLVEFVKSKLGIPYVYGCKGEVLTLEKYNYLQKMYGKSYVWDSDRQKVGKVCCDCSGLISWYTGKMMGSAQLRDKAVVCKLIATLDSAPIGAILWKPGHVGVYIVKENGEHMYIAEDGSAYGCRKNKVSKSPFTHWLMLDCIDYVQTKKVDEELQRALDKIVTEGVKINASNWNDISKMNMKYAQALVEKIGSKFGKANYPDTVDCLVSEEIITDRELWDKKEFTPTAIRSLILKIASKI